MSVATGTREKASPPAISANRKVWWCLAGNAATLALVTALVVFYRDPGSKYYRFGPQEDLILVSIRIDTWGVWGGVLVVMGLVRVCETLVNEIGSPILGFRVYNPDCTEISDFSKNELNFLANAMWLVNGLRGVLTALVAVTQIDLAIAGVVFSEAASVVAIHFLLNEKTFVAAESNSPDEGGAEDVELVALLEAQAQNV